MITRRSVPRLLLSAMILGGIPALSLARQNVSPDTVTLALPATLSVTGDRVQIDTVINEIDLSDLAGDKNMSVGDIVYLHLNLSSGGGDKAVRQLNYPYAISQNRPLRLDVQTLSLRGLVTEKDGDKLRLQYLFEDLPYRRGLSNHFSDVSTQDATIILSVNHRAVGHVETIELNGESFAIR